MASIINASTSAGLIQTADTSGVLQLQTAGTAAVTVDASQNVGIGTASPNAKLTISSGATVNNFYTATSGTNTYTPTALTSLIGANWQIQAGNASGACTGIRLSQGSSFELFLGGVQESGGAAAFVFQGYNGTSYAERMRIDSSGNVGIGTSSPGERLRVQNTTGVNTTFTNNVDADVKINLTSGVALISPSTGVLALGTNSTERMRIDSNGNLLVGQTSNYVGESNWVESKSGYVFAANNTGSSSNRNWIISPNGSAAGNLDFINSSTNTGWPNAAYVMSLDPNGNLLVGTTGNIGSAPKIAAVQSATNLACLGATASSASYAYNILDLNTATASGTGFTFIKCRVSSYTTTVFEVGGNGRIFSAPLSGGATTVSVDASGYIIRTPSDSSLKTNIQPITYGLDTVMKLKPIKHEWVEEINMGAPSIGFIAQDMELEVPEVVSGEEYKSIDYPKLTAVLTKAIQEQQAIITSLTDRITALEGAK